MKPEASDLTPVIWEANSSRKEVTTPTQVFRSKSSDTQAAMLGKFIN